MKEALTADALAAEMPTGVHVVGDVFGSASGCANGEAFASAANAAKQMVEM